jgi:hypothetical protein
MASDANVQMKPQIRFGQVQVEMLAEESSAKFIPIRKCGMIFVCFAI